MLASFGILIFMGVNLYVSSPQIEDGWDDFIDLIFSFAVSAFAILVLVSFV